MRSSFVSCSLKCTLVSDMTTNNPISHYANHFEEVDGECAYCLEELANANKKAADSVLLEFDGGQVEGVRE